MQLEQLKIWRHHKHLAVAVLADEASVVSAVRHLHRAGIANDQISVPALDTEHVHAAIDAVGPFQGQVMQAGESADALAEECSTQGVPEAKGMAIGGGVGLLLGLGVFALPGFGAMVLAAGPVGWAVNVFAHTIGGAVGIGALLGAIFDERVTEDHRDFFRAQLERGRWLLVVHGDDPAIERAAKQLREEHCERVETF